MNIRFLKKKDGTKILQYKDMGTLQYKDVPMVEEELNAKDILMKELCRFDLSNKDFSILMSESFAKKIYDQEDHQNIYSTYRHTDISSFYGVRVFVTKMREDFKFLKEI